MALTLHRLAFNRADARMKELAKLISEADEAPPAIHPAMADRYRREVSRLVATLNDAAQRTEAASLIRDLVDRIVLRSNPSRSELMIDLHGDLVGILNVANGKKPPAGAGGGKGKGMMDAQALDSFVVWAQGKMVEGARLALDLQGQDKLVAGARHSLALLFNDFEIKPRSYPGPRP